MHEQSALKLAEAGLLLRWLPGGEGHSGAEEEARGGGEGLRQGEPLLRT